MTEQPPYSLWQLGRYFLKLGTIGFGGPVALAEYMRRDLVEDRRWISEVEYREGLALAQLSPGPLAAQLAFYLGFVHYRVTGAALVGLAFVLPSFLIVVALGWAYLEYGGLAWMQAVFYAVGASVIGIIAFSAYKLATKNIARDPVLWIIYLLVAVVTIITESEQVLLFLGAGILRWALKGPPRGWLSRIGFAIALPLTAAVPVLATVEPPRLGKIFLFFTYAGAFVFGSGLAIVPFLYGGLVNDYQWLTEHQFLDAVAVAMITPGPIVITTGFIGFLLAGLPGAVVAAAATFLPAFLLTVIPAPYFRKHGRRPGISAFVEGVTAAAIGAITGAVVVLGRRSIIDVPTAILAVTTLILLWKGGRKAPEPLIVLGAAILGLVFHPLVHP